MIIAYFLNADNKQNLMNFITLSFSRNWYVFQMLSTTNQRSYNNYT
jgi:hypothetical protein